LIQSPPYDILGIILDTACRTTGDRRSNKGLGFAGGRAGSDSSGATEAALGGGVAFPRFLWGNGSRFEEYISLKRGWFETT